MYIYLLSKTETLTLSAPFRTLDREHVGTLPSLFQGVPGAREGRPAHGHVRASRSRGERVRGRYQALGHRDGPRRRRRPPSRNRDRRDDRQERRAAGFLRRPAAGLHLREIAPLMNWGAIEIVPTNASKPGILAGVAAIIAQAGISIRQVIMDDPEIVDDPHGFIVTEAPVPERLLPQIKQVDGVKSVVLH